MSLDRKLRSIKLICIYIITLKLTEIILKTLQFEKEKRFLSDDIKSNVDYFTVTFKNKATFKVLTPYKL